MQMDFTHPHIEDAARAEGLEGSVVILWEMANFNSLPIVSYGEYFDNGDVSTPGLQVLVLASNVKLVGSGKSTVIVNEVRFLLYELSDASRALLIEDNRRFVEACGHVRSYLRGTTPVQFNLTDSSKLSMPFSRSNNTANPQSEYTSTVEYDKLDVKLVGSVPYKSVLNPFPHVEVPGYHNTELRETPPEQASNTEV